MGLGWIINRKPIKGYETEFIKLNKLFDKLLLNGEYDTDDIENKINSISIAPNINNNINNIDNIFSGKCIYNSSLINYELKEEACNDHNYIQAIDYANRLEIDISSININNLNDDELEDYNYIIKAIKWLKYFGEDGFGFSVCY
jgi:hypothetical protein